MFNFAAFYPAKPAVSFDLPADVEAQAVEKLGTGAVTALKIIFQGLGLTPQTAQDILAALLQNWKAIAARIIQANGADAVTYLASLISGLPEIPAYVRQPLSAMLVQFGPFLIQAILSKLA